MNPSAFFAYLTNRDDDGAPLSTSGTTPCSSTSKTVKVTPVIDKSARTTSTSNYHSHPSSNNNNAETHFSLLASRAPKSGSAGLSDGAATTASNGGGGDDSGVGSSERPNMLKEWCGILYYSCRDVTAMSYRAVRNATAAGLKKAAFEDESWSFFHECPAGAGPQHGPFAHLHRCYTQLATTRTCAWMLPGVPDAPLVVHVAGLILTLEALQAASFYFRYKKAMRATEAALAEAEAALEAEDDAAAAEEEAEDEADGGGGSNTARNAEGALLSARAGSEISTSRTARARLPRGSSRSMHRLCSYWALIEKAVRRAPQKPAGVPTTAAELGRFFGGDNAEGGDGSSEAEGNAHGHARPPASGTSEGGDKRFTSDGVPHGAEKVLVLCDERTFPVIHRSYDHADSATTTPDATVASSMDAMAPLEATLASGVNSRSGPLASGNGVLSPPRMLPPIYPATSPDATLRSRSGTPPPPLPTLHPPTTVVLNEMAQPWQVFHCLWTDTVRYSVNYTEIRQLLLGCSVTEIAKLFEEEESHHSHSQHPGTGGSRTAREHVFRHLWRSMSRQPSTEAFSNTSENQVDSPLHNSAAASFSAHCLASPSSQSAAAAAAAASPRFTDGRVCVVCMALTWYLALVREVYEAVVVHQDVQRCADALDELEEYQRAIYQRGVEVGAEFFEEALRCAMPRTEDSSSVNASHHPNLPKTNSSSTNNVTDMNAPLSHGDERLSSNHNNNVGGGSSSSGFPRRLLLPQVASGVDAAHDVSIQQQQQPQQQQLPPLFSPPPSLNSHEDVTLRHGLSSSNPLAFEFSPSPNMPLPAHHDRSHYCVILHGASPRACWAELTAALAALLRRRRLMELACVRSLFFYMYTGSAAKIVSFSILALLTSMSSRIAALGQATREAISTNLDTYYRASASQVGHGSSGGGGCGSSASNTSSSSCGGGGDEGTPAGPRILALFTFECTRLAVNTVLARMTNEYITLAASQRRNTVKAELYEALTRMPLAFFDLHSYDEVEQIVYYVNDIEGVEVHVHNYVCSLVTSLFAMQHALRQLPFRARVLVGVTVAASLAVKYVGQKVTSWTQTAQKTGGVLPPWLRGSGLDGTVSATAELDAQVEENMESNARQGGVMLRGLDIVAVLPQLRPYAADLSLMRWWTDHTRTCGAASGLTEATTLAEGLMVLPRQLYGKIVPAFGAAMLTFADWVLPTVVSSYGASMAFSGVDALSLSNRLIEAMRCVGDTVDTVVDARRVAEVVLLNAYKANVLEKVLDQRRWEPTTMDFMKDYTHSYGSGDAEGEESEGVESASASRTAQEQQQQDRDNENMHRTVAACTGNGGEEASRTQTASGELHNTPDGPPRRQRSSTGTPHTTQQQQHQQAVSKSFKRVPTKKAPWTAQLWRRCTYGAAWLLAHSPPMLATQVVLYVVRKGFHWAGFFTQDARSPSTLAGASMDKKGQLRQLRRRTRHRQHQHQHHGHHHDGDGQHAHKHRGEKSGQRTLPHDGTPRGEGEPLDQSANSAAAAHPSLRLERSRMSSSPEEAANGGSVSVQSPFLRVDRYGSGGGSVSDGNCTEAYYSDVLPDSGRVDVSSSSASAASYSESESESVSCSETDSDTDDADDLTSEAAAAAAATALVSATVHAITVQNLQFYYPTAPTVPVFPKPITCTFTLQNEEWLSPSLTSPSSQSSSSAVQGVEQMRGRLVCLVGPSGHGKSTLLSLLLGMYTHYGSPAQRAATGGGGGGGGNFASASAAAWGGSGTQELYSAGEMRTGSENDNDGQDEGEDAASTVSFGSPRLVDTAGLPCLPPDIILTLHMPRPPPRRHGRHGRSISTTTAATARGVSGMSGVSAETDFVEEQLPVSVIPRDILRGNLFSFVPQSPVIFSGATIAHNISLENFVSLEQEELLAEIAQCAAWAHCEYIQRFPQGLMTYIADSGTGAWSSPLASAAAGSGGAGGGGGMVRLSGGQAQRLMMARALFHGRRGGTVLVMDEPTASLDHEVKVEILAEWRELLDKGIVRGMVCATHDPDLINVADEVVRLP